MGSCFLSSEFIAHAGNVGPTFPVIVTSYEIVLADAKFLAQYKYQYIVVDEGHRLKNYNSKLLRELRTLDTTNKLLLTGGDHLPLHVAQDLPLYLC